MTFEKPWQNRLNDALALPPGNTAINRPRVSILGIGHELRGDDAAGIEIARSLAPMANERLQVVEGAHAPENQLGVIGRFHPDLVLMIDAAEMGRCPGEIAWLEWQETSGISASSHTLPPYMIGKYLRAMLDCRVALLGIQPGNIRLQAGLSDDVRRAVDKVCKHLASILGTPAKGGR